MNHEPLGQPTLGVFVWVPQLASELDGRQRIQEIVNGLANDDRAAIYSDRADELPA